MLQLGRHAGRRGLVGPAAVSSLTASLTTPRTTTLPTLPTLPSPARRAFASRPPAPAPPDADGRSFRGQMLESISARMAREKAERERLARERQDSAATRNAAMTFMLAFVGAACYYLGYKMPRDPDPASTLALEATRAPKHTTGRAALEAAWADFVAIVGADDVSTAGADIAAHATSDWSTYRPAEGAGAGAGAGGVFCVVYPHSTDEVAAVMKVCHARRIPVTGYSGGTSLEGNYAPTRGGIVVDFSRHMDRVLALHRDDLDAVVQPGVGWEALNDELADAGLFFPPDPGPGAQIGGMIGTGCSGTNAYRYGTMRDWVLSLTVVLADGTVIRTRQRPRKSAAGYDLTRLLVGSEGTLGLVTEATLRLAVRPAHTSVAVATFGRLRDAAACAAQVVARGVPVAAVEVLDAAQMRAVNAAGTTSRVWPEAPTLFFKFAGDSPRAVRDQVDTVQALARDAGGVQSFAFARSPAEQLELWSARKEALWSAISALKSRAGPDGKPLPGAVSTAATDRVWTGDVAVPVSRLPDALEATQAGLAAAGLRGTIVGHVGDGNFHAIVVYDGADAAEAAAAEHFVHDMVKNAIALEGTVTGEHGVGLVKRDYLPHELGADTVAAMRRIKAALDPLCLLNCDKVVRMQKPAPGEVAEW